MTSPLPESLIGAAGEMAHVHRRVVRVGAASAWAASAIFLVSGFLSGQTHLFVQSVAPVLAASFMTALVLVRRENAGVAMVGAAIVVMVWVVVAGTEDTLLPAAVSLVVICAIGMLFVTRGQRIALAVIGVGLFAAPQLWMTASGEGFRLGLGMSLSFLLTAAIFMTVSKAASALNARFQMLFEHSPTAVMEEDWSKALAYVRSEYTGKPERIRPFLMAYPEVVRRAVGRARIVRVNSAAVTLLEADGPEELLGYRDGDKITDETLPAFVDALVALYEGSSVFEQETPAISMKGTPMWLQLRSVDVSSGVPGSTVLVGMADVTLMRSRQEAMADLVRSKSEFIARVSHELRTPLTAVMGLTREMTGSSLSEGERDELMHLVSGQAEEMSHIVEDLLVAARVESGNITIESEPVSLGDALDTTLRGMTVRVSEIPESSDVVMADPNRLRQIIRNLLTNAERYGGPTLRILSGSSEGIAWLEVRDDGDGVPDEDTERIFEPYASSHQGVPGSVGLGLSVARQLAEMMGGSLSHFRSDGETVFRLELTLARVQEQALSGKAWPN
ncbi:MAG: HAMP domain-containing sensor histidine kinase [Acidimicrobiia bacterium]|nr:HAMP domain-containing sensor histidine kinase [Acidimicrobiia bacterium]